MTPELIQKVLKLKNRNNRHIIVKFYWTRKQATKSLEKELLASNCLNLFSVEYPEDYLPKLLFVELVPQQPLLLLNFPNHAANVYNLRKQ